MNSLLGASRLRIPIVLSLFFALAFYITYLTQFDNSWIRKYQRSSSRPSISTLAESSISVSANSNSSISLAEYYALPIWTEFCENHFSLGYIQNLRNSALSYCTHDSISTVSCFRSRTSKDGRVDSFCFADGVKFGEKKGSPLIDVFCDEVDHESNTVPVPDLHSLSEYWYDTGPGMIFRKFINIISSSSDEYPKAAVPGTTDPIILIKREEKYDNLWHTWMEIFSLSLTLDTLRTTINPNTGTFFIPPTTAPQILILDDHPPGPFFSLWSAFAPGGVHRKSQFAAPPRNTRASSSIIVPLAGGANPFWQGDWEAHACAASPQLAAFSDRAMALYGLAHVREEAVRPIAVTYVVRRGRRRLVEEDALLGALHKAYPDVELQAVDFGALSFEEQIRVAMRTDVLVGVHGAGLTHAMFMRPGSALVEILPAGFSFMGLRNLAHLRGHSYFSAHGFSASVSRIKRSWQDEDVSIETERFVKLVSIAIKAMYNTGLRHDDVI